ncbi:MAG: hypothetical protein SFY66_00660 [Oculatellaceae cyanobacterium bins.114]|nr:hypothetical protein [Oculatellaceae cyanobacterium bins.114]
MTPNVYRLIGNVTLTLLATVPLVACGDRPSSPTASPSSEMQPASTTSSQTTTTASETEQVTQVAIAELQKLGGAVTLSNLVIVEDYALANWSATEAEGQILLQRTAGTWQVLTQGGGALATSPEALQDYGVPASLAQSLFDQFQAAVPASEPEAIATPVEAMSESSSAASTLALETAQASIGGISTTATEADVRQILGEPLEAKDEENQIGLVLRRLEYPTLSVGLADGTVYSLSTRSPDMPTADGIRVGDTQQQVIEAYGQPHEITTENNVTQLVYYVNAPATWIFQVEGNYPGEGTASHRIVEISYFALLN